MQRVSFALKPTSVQEIRKNQELLPSLSRDCGFEDFSLRGHMLEIWAEKPDVCRTELSARGWLKAPRKAPPFGSSQVDNCSLCMCEFDDDTRQLQGCHHRFCAACIQGALSNPDGSHFPIACPHPKDEGMCGDRIVWRDITSLAKGDVLPRIKRIAVDAFVRDFPGQAMFCPKPGCNHILQPASKENRDGGVEVHCELCAVSYCLECTEKLKQPRLQHIGSTCMEAQADADPGVRVHKDHIIENFLTLRCPRCRRAFQDYEGCAAIKCENCSCGFCGKCFKDCGTDAHAHVRECIGPGIPGVQKVPAGYSLSTPEFHRLSAGGPVSCARIFENFRARTPASGDRRLPA